MTPSNNLGKVQADMIVDGCSDFSQKVNASRFEKDEVKKVTWDLKLALVLPNLNTKHYLFARSFPSRRSVFQMFRFPKNLFLWGLEWRETDRNTFWSFLYAKLLFVEVVRTSQLNSASSVARHCGEGRTGVFCRNEITVNTGELTWILEIILRDPWPGGFAWSVKKLNY